MTVTRLHQQCLFTTTSIELTDARFQVAVPVLVDRVTGVPPVLAMRYLVRVLVYRNRANTIAAKLGALGWLYDWGVRYYGARYADADLGGLTVFDRQLLDVPIVGGDDLTAMVAFMRNRPAGGRGTGREAVSPKQLFDDMRVATQFLAWVADPQLRGGEGTVPLEEVGGYTARVKTLAGAAVSGKAAQKTERIPPLASDAEKLLWDVVRPKTDDEGNFRRTRDGFVWDERNPFPLETRLRNAVLISLQLECGFRIGEVLHLWHGDITKDERDEPVVDLRNHFGDKRWLSRKRQSKLKTKERPMPLSVQTDNLVRAYISEPPRRGGRGTSGCPALFIAEHRGHRDAMGYTMAWTVCGEAFRVLAEAGHEAAFSPHSLRHTYMEGYADALFKEGDEKGVKVSIEEVESMLRKVGGWSSASKEPSRYAHNALQRRSMRSARALAEARTAVVRALVPDLAPTASRREAMQKLLATAIAKQQAKADVQEARAATFAAAAAAGHTRTYRATTDQ